MRTKIFLSLLIVVSAIAPVSCQKDTLANIVEESDVSTILFTATRPQLEEDTKTEWNGNRVVWSNGDKIRMAYTVDGIWQKNDGNISAGGKAKFYQSNQAVLSGDKVTATFPISASFTGTTSGNHKFYGLYPSAAYTGSGTDIDPTAVKVSIASSQPLSADTFHSDSDLMLGVSVGEYDSRPQSVNMEWNRLVAHAQITLKNIGEGEELRSVTLTTDKNVCGTYSLDLTTGELSADETSSTITLEGGVGVVDGKATFWVSFIPCLVESLSVVANTDRAIYTREISTCSLNFKKNMRNILAIDMSKGSREEIAASDIYYEKVTENLDDWSGIYLIIDEGASVALDGSMTTTLDATDNTVDVTIVDSRVKSSNNVDSYSFTIEPTEEENTYKICSASGRYIGRSASSAGINNATSYNSNNHKNTIEYSDGACYVKGQSGYVLKYNGTTKIAYYKTGSIQLYKKAN